MHNEAHNVQHQYFDLLLALHELVLALRCLLELLVLLAIIVLESNRAEFVQNYLEGLLLNATEPLRELSKCELELGRHPIQCNQRVKVNKSF